MRNPTKLSDRALEHSIQTNWQLLLDASKVRRFFKTIMMTLGLTSAVALPLLNSDPISSLVGPPGPAGEDGVDGKNFEKVDSGSDDNPDDDTPPVQHSHDGISSNITVLNKNEIEIRSAPPSKIWHRSVFEKIGDEFWGLPDSNIKLKLIGSSTNPCNLQSCDATFKLNFDQYQGVPDSPYEVKMFSKRRAIKLVNKTDSTKPMPEACRIIDDPTPYLLCRLKSINNSKALNEDVCLWLRRATKGERENEMVALDIRWEKIDSLNDRNCGGDFDRNRYEPTTW